MANGKWWLTVALSAALFGCGGDNNGNPGGSGGTSGAGGAGAIGGAGGSPEIGPVPAGQCKLGPRTRVTTADGKSADPAIVWTGSNYLLLWDDARGGGTDIYGTKLSAAGARADAMDTLVADTGDTATSPELARLASGQLLAVFEDCHAPDAAGNCTGGSVVRAIPLGATGQPGGAITDVSTLAAVQRRPYVTAAYGGAYATYRDLDGAKVVARVAQLDASGNPGSAVVMGNGAEGMYPALAASTNGLAVVYRRGGTTPEIVFALLNPSMAVQRELVLRTGSPTEATNPALAWNGAGWTVAWEDLGEGDGVVISREVGPDGAQASAAQTLQGDNGNWPAVASNGHYSLVAFYGFPMGAQVMVARVDSAGNRVGDVLQVTGDGGTHGKFPSIAYNDTADEFAVTWQDDGTGEIYFARIKCQ